MQSFILIETGLFLAAAITLIWAAVTDLLYRTISNRLSLILIGLFVVSAAAFIADGTSWKVAYLWPVVSASLIFAIGIALFAGGIMGGGDVKLIAATALFAGPTLSLPMVLYITVVGGLVALLTLFHARFTDQGKSQDESQQTGSPTGYEKPETPNTTQGVPQVAPQVPYGIAISCGGLWVCFQRIIAL